jgi:hypothetical protein
VAHFSVDGVAQFSSVVDTSGTVFFSGTLFHAQG